jgi:hypothetical protein
MKAYVTLKWKPDAAWPEPNYAIDLASAPRAVYFIEQNAHDDFNLLNRMHAEQKLTLTAPDGSPMPVPAFQVEKLDSEKWVIVCDI